MIIDIVKPEVQSSNTEVYIQNSNGLCVSYFYHMIKTCIWWGLSSVIADVRLILEDSWLCHYIDMLISPWILITMKYTIYYQKWFDEHFLTQVQSCESIQSFMRW